MLTISHTTFKNKTCSSISSESQCLSTLSPSLLQQPKYPIHTRTNPPPPPRQPTNAPRAPHPTNPPPPLQNKQQNNPHKPASQPQPSIQPTKSPNQTMGSCLSSPSAEAPPPPPRIQPEVIRCSKCDTALNHDGEHKNWDIEEDICDQCVGEENEADKRKAQFLPTYE